MRVPYSYTSPYYDNAEFAVANATTDYDVASNQANLFGGTTSDVGTAVYFCRIITDQTVTVKFNSTSNDSITITSSMSPLVLDETIEISNVFITNNSGSNANVKILTAKPNK